MAKYRPIVITNAGNTLLAKAIEGTAEISFTSFYLTSVVYSDTQLKTLTKTALTTAGINQQSVVSNIRRLSASIVQIETGTSNESLATAYTLRTIALGAIDPDAGEIIFAGCGATSPDFIPAYDGRTSNSFVFKFQVSISNEANVDMEVSSAGVATIADIEAIENTIADMCDGVIEKIRFGIDEVFTGLPYTEYKINDGEKISYLRNYYDNSGSIIKFSSDDGVNWVEYSLNHANVYNYGAVKPSDTYSATGTAANGLVPSQKALSDGLATKAPTSHASPNTTYGIGTASNYGHVMLSDGYSDTDAASTGKAPSRKALSDGLATKAPTSHASNATTYGIGTASNYGHVMLSDTYSNTDAASTGKAPSRKALSDGLATKAPTSHAASALTYGGATASNYGHVKLSDSYSDTGTAANSLGASQKALSDGLATKAAKTEAIKNITRSGTTFTATRTDGTTFTFTQQDTNTTYSNMTAASASAAGKAGLVPAPAAGKQTSFLRGDGTWVVPTNTTYSNMTAATASAAGKAGLVPAPDAGKQASFLRGDGTWVVPTNTTYSVATTSANGLMSTAMVTKLNGIATGANAYTHPSYTARTGKPTGNASPGFGGTFQVSQITSDASGHVTGATDRTITIPSTVVSTSSAGLMSVSQYQLLTGLNNNGYYGAATYKISPNRDVAFIIIDVPVAGAYLIHSFVKTNTSVNVLYTSQISVSGVTQTVRQSGLNGGGICNMMFANLAANSQITINLYHSNSSDVEFYGNVYALRLKNSNITWQNRLIG